MINTISKEKDVAVLALCGAANNNRNRGKKVTENNEIMLESQLGEKYI